MWIEQGMLLSMSFAAESIFGSLRKALANAAKHPSLSKHENKSG